MSLIPASNLDLLAHALLEGGTAEVPGATDNPKIVNWFAMAGAPWIANDETAWCSAFMCAMAQKAGLQHPRSVRAKKWLELTASQATPVNLTSLLPGDVVIFDREGGGHVGLFLYRIGSELAVFGGNQGNRVQERRYSAANLLGGRRLLRAAA